MQVPNWHSAEGEEVIHYTFNPLEPRSFYVYPIGEKDVELIYARAPDQVTKADNMALPDVYANALLDYILYRAYTKDAEEAANRELAQTHYVRFTESLGMKAQVDGATIVSQSKVVTGGQ